MPPESAKPEAGFLLDIDAAAADAVRYCAGLTWERFLQDDKTQRATIYAILIVGEATKNISNSYRVGHPEIPWKKMAGMRDRLVHGYDQVDLEAVWEVVVVHLPQLRALLAPLLPPPGASPT